MKNRIKALIAVILFCVGFALMGLAVEPENTKAAAVGYTDHGHNFTDPSKCGSAGCNGTGYSTKKAYAGLNGNTKCSMCSGNKTSACTAGCTSGKVKCTTCSGLGYTSKTTVASGKVTVNGTQKSYGCYVTKTACTACGGSGFTRTYYSGTTPSGGSLYTDGSCSNGTGKVNCSTCEGDGLVPCAQCKGSGYYGLCGRCNGQKKNYYCQNSNCAQGYTGYDHWESEPNYNSVCYTTENHYNIVFNGNGADGGSTGAINNIAYTQAVNLTANGFYKNGHSFAGWNTDPNGNGTACSDGQLVSHFTATDLNTVTLYAQWTKNSYNVYFDAAGGQGAPGTQSFVFNSQATISTTKPTRTGYTFVRWKASHADYYMNPGAAIPEGWGTFTLIAEWSQNQYVLSLNLNGGETIYTNSVAVTYDSSANCYLDYNIPTRAGYTFTGWYTSATGGTKVYGADGRTVTDGTYWKGTANGIVWNYPGNVTLYAQWEKNVYSVTYLGNTGFSEINSIENYYGQPIDLSVSAHKEGWIHIGWNTDPNATEGLSDMVMPEADVTLYAIYSIPVSDIKDVYIKIWPQGNENNYRIYYLGKTDSLNMKYTYKLQNDEVIHFLNGAAPDYTIIVMDNAGNSTALVGDDEEPKYLQTVEHYMLVNNEWIKFNTITDERYKGETYNPVYTEAPIGYKTSSISPGYVVEGDTISKAYYVPIEYRVMFDAMGGECDISYKTVFYGDAYGELPIPIREGYVFQGWYTDKEYGTLVRSESKHLILEDVTLYAKWQVKSFKVIYDYSTNGGDTSGKVAEVVNYGAEIDLLVSAHKAGWIHIGWNTNPDATTALSSLKMGTADVVLYAIYKKDITITFISQTTQGRKTEQFAFTLYNTQEQEVIAVPKQGEWTGWEPLGWTLSQEPTGITHTSEDSFYECKENLTFYGKYSKEVKLTYDTNGASTVIEDQRKTRYYNAFGTYKNPSFDITDGVMLENSSFVSWEELKTGNEYAPGDTIELLDNMTLIAKWDKYPEITAYNRYFTLADAKAGRITELVLLEKVTAMDAEDGILVNGVDVIVLDYDATRFSSMTDAASVTITYYATDSFGNTVQKDVLIQVVDTSVNVSNRVTYYRFISNRFYKDGDVYVPASKGGLEETSIWKTDATYQSLMDAVMSNKKTNQVTKKLSFYGNEKEYVVPGSGEWEHVEETWYFTKEDIAKTNDFREQYGFGSSKVTNYLEMFLEWFGHCKK